jgi:hypothetical protein
MRPHIRRTACASQSLVALAAALLAVSLCGTENGGSSSHIALAEERKPEEKPLDKNNEKAQEPTLPWGAKGYTVIVAKVTAHEEHVRISGGADMWNLSVSFRDRQASKEYRFGLAAFSQFGLIMSQANGKMCILVFKPSENGVLSQSAFAAIVPLDWATGQGKDVPQGPL